MKLAATMRWTSTAGQPVGRGDKDIGTVATCPAPSSSAPVVHGPGGEAMSRIAKTFADLAERHRKALIPYICAGDPLPDATVDVMLAMADAGATSSNSACRFPTRWPTAR